MNEDPVLLHQRPSELQPIGISVSTRLSANRFANSPGAFILTELVRMIHCLPRREKSGVRKITEEVINWVLKRIKCETDHLLGQFLEFIRPSHRRKERA